MTDLTNKCKCGAWKPTGDELCDDCWDRKELYIAEADHAYAVAESLYEY